MNKVFLSSEELAELEQSAANEIHYEHLLTLKLQEKGLKTFKVGYMRVKLAGLVKKIKLGDGYEYVQSHLNRQNGKTSQQMLDCVGGSLYFWPSPRLEYPIQLAERLGRIDLQIYYVGDLRRADRWHGREIYGVTVDHACELRERDWDEVDQLRSRIRNELP